MLETSKLNSKITIFEPKLTRKNSKNIAKNAISNRPKKKCFEAVFFCKLMMLNRMEISEKMLEKLAIASMVGVEKNGSIFCKHSNRATTDIDISAVKKYFADVSNFFSNAR